MTHKNLLKAINPLAGCSDDVFEQKLLVAKTIQAMINNQPKPTMLTKTEYALHITSKVRGLVYTPRIRVPKKHTQTKFDKAELLYQAHKTMSRKELITLLQRKLGMTKAGATTYLARIVKSQQT